MTNSLKKEIKKIIESSEMKLDSYTEKITSEVIKEFQIKVDWEWISQSQKLSEELIRKFKDKVNWYWISESQQLSEEFIREFQDKIDWREISQSQQLSEEFIREFQNKVDWDWISYYQKLSEEFIREFQDEVYWDYISISQKLSKDFIREFKNEVNWYWISIYQNQFLQEFSYKVNIEVYQQVHEKKTYQQKLKEIERYAKKHNLKFDGEYLYAFRDHDNWGRGQFNPTIKYESGKYYYDWHCDMRKEEENSFGLGIWPKGNTPIRVKVEDWGVAVNRIDGKARVWGFEII